MRTFNERNVRPRPSSEEQIKQLRQRYGFAPSHPVGLVRRFGKGLGRTVWIARPKLYAFAKRLFDVVCASLLLLLLSPLLITVAAAIKMTDGGPILFRQRRVGRWGQSFEFPKFRSMVPKADQIVHQLRHQNDHGNSVTFKMKNDPRITRVGKLIRSLSIDELPQLWCVLRGDMSLVGPRPALPSEVANYRQSDRRRLDVTPGLTCIWQVSGRGDLPFPKQVVLDIEYIEKQSFRLDLELLLQTVPAVLTRRGAY